MNEDTGNYSATLHSSQILAAEFIRNKQDGHRRFMIRPMVRGWQVYGWKNEHVAMCDTKEDADMVRDALESLADSTVTMKPTGD